MSTLDAFIGSTVRPERSVRLCSRGDLTGALEQARRELATAQSRKQTSLSDGGGVATAEARVAELEAAVDADSTTFTLRGISARQWSDLVAANPPRDGDAGDQAYGYNTATLFLDLVTACLVDPAATRDQVEQLADALSSGQWDALAEAAVAVSRGKVDVPFSPPVSPATEASG